MRKALRFAALVMALVMAMSMGACKKKNEGGPGKNSEEEIRKGTQYNPDGETQLVWMHWEDYQDVNNAMIEEYVKLHPEIGITSIYADAFEYEEVLLARAAASSLPDVFWVISLPDVVMNDWSYDMTEMFNNDPDTAMIYPNYKEIGVYSDKRMGMAIHSLPYVAYLNADVFARYNMPMPEYTWTFEEALQMAKDISHPEEFYYGLGKATFFNLDYLPRVINILKSDNMGDYGFIPGEGYNFNQNWIDMVNERNALHTQGVYDVMTSEEKEAEFGDSGAWTVAEGRTAIDFGFLYEQWTILHDWGLNKGVEFEIYPFPQGTSGNIPGGLFMATIAKNTKYPQECYDFLKFMSWGREGWSYRMNKFVENEHGLNLLPIIDDASLWAELKEKLAPDDLGMQAVMDSVPNCKIEVNRSIPGWSAFENWESENGMFGGMENWREPTIDPADVAEQLTEKANEFYFDAIKQIEEVINK